MNTHRKLLIFLLFLCCLPMAAGAAGPDLRELAVKADHLVVLRHAQAPGTGDPSNFRLGDCSTQRNLSPEGREQAARNLAVGPVVELPALKTIARASRSLLRCERAK